MFSIIIPVFNDRKIASCLKSLNNNDVTDCEVICVDNNSTDPEIKKIISQYKVKYIKETRPGSYTARNTGARNAQGDILVFLDSDCEPSADWLKNIKEAFQNNIDGLMGKIIGKNKNKIAEFEQKFYEAVTGKFLNQEKYLKRIDTRNFAIKKEIFNKLKGFNEALQYGGDMEFGARAYQAGYKISYAESVIVSHANETNLDKIIDKRIKQNYDNYNITKYHDENFIKQYFPHLLAGKQYNKYYYIIAFYLPVLIKLTKIFKIYFFYKYANIFAIKFGQLLNINSKGHDFQTIIQ